MGLASVPLEQEVVLARVEEREGAIVGATCSDTKLNCNRRCVNCIDSPRALKYRVHQEKERSNCLSMT